MVNKSINYILILFCIVLCSSNSSNSSPIPFSRTLGIKPPPVRGAVADPIINVEGNLNQTTPLPPDYTEAFFKRHYQENKTSLIPYDQTKELIKSHAFRQRDAEVIRYFSQPLTQAYYIIKQNIISGYALQDEINFSGYETHQMLLNIKSLSKNQKLSKKVSSEIEFETRSKVSNSHVERYVVLKYDYETRLIYDAFYDKSYHKFFEQSLKQYLKEYEKALL